MKKILLSTIMLFVCFALQAQTITGDAARDAKIKTESQKLTEDGIVVIDEQTLFELSDEEFEIETKGYWPKNQLTENLILPKFGGNVETSVYATTSLKLLWFYAILKCELTDVEKYTDELKAAGWNIDAKTQRQETVFSFDARHKSGHKMHLTHNQREKLMKIEIDSRE